MSSPVPFDHGDERQEERLSSPKAPKQAKERFIIHFISAVDIPTPESRNKTSPYLRAYLSSYVSETDADGQQFRLKRISDVVLTPKRLDCQSVIWNSYRDFRIKPPSDAILTLEVLHATSDSTECLLGRAEIPITRLVDESPISIPLICHRGDRQKTPKFSVTIARCFITDEPPARKVLFLVRHGESKWNEAQSRINITGMLDRDHSLTELGVFQAMELNKRWRMHDERKQREMQQMTAKEPKPFSQESEPEPEQVAETADLLGLDDGAEACAAVPEPAPVGDAFDAFSTDFTSSALSSTLASDGTETELLTLPPSNSPLTLPVGRKACPPPPPVLTTSSSQPDLWNLLYRPMDPRDLVEEQEKMQNIETRQSFDEDEEGDVDGDSSSDEEEEEDERVRECKEEEDMLKAEVVEEAPVGSYRSNADDLISAFHKTDVKIREDKAAAARRRSDYIELFLHADKAYSSPLTRALETALVSLEGHHVLGKTGLQLYSIIREVKNIGGLDTVGIEVGEGIGRRAKAELSAVLTPQRAADLLDLELHVNDADQVWWTPMASYDSEKDQQDRIQEFITFMRYCDGKIPIVVGHSLFFKAFYSKRISRSLSANRKYLSHNLQKFRLSNASMLAVTVVFGDVANGCSEASILDADLIFGGGFHGQGAHGNRNSLERKASLALNEANLIAQQTSPSKSAGGESDEEDGGGRPAGPQRKKSESGNALASMIGNAFHGHMGFATNLTNDFKNKKEALTKGVKKISETLTDTLHDIFEKG